MSRESIAKRMERSSQLNQEIFWGYYKQQLEQGKNVSTIPSALSKIIEDTGHKDINQLQIEDIHKSLTKKKLAPSTLNSRIDFLKTFFTYASEVVTLNFDISELNDLKIEKSEVDASKEEKWESLSIEEVISLRNKLRELKRYRALYYFEMFYYFGLETDELLNLHSGNYDETERKFQIHDTVYALPSQLYDIVQFKIIPKKKFNITTPSYYLTPIEKIFGKKVTRGDIIATRNQNFFKCPKCGDMYEAAPENWVVFHYEIDDSKWIICRKNCMEEGLNE